MLGVAEVAECMDEVPDLVQHLLGSGELENL